MKRNLAWKSVLETLQSAPLPYEPMIEAERKRKDIEGNGIKRIQPVMELIRRKYNLKKHKRVEAIFVTLRT